MTLAKPVIARTLTLDRGSSISRRRLERVTGIEPAPSAWKAEVLPLNYSRLSYLPRHSIGGGRWIRTSEGVSQQIYSLPPLAAWVPLRGQEPAIVLRDSRGVNGLFGVEERF